MRILTLPWQLGSGGWGKARKTDGREQSEQLLDLLRMVFSSVTTAIVYGFSSGFFFLFIFLLILMGLAPNQR